MNINLFETTSLLRATEQIASVPSFLLDTFFPNENTLLTETVFIETMKGTRKVAPFVAPKVGGVTIDRDGRTLSTVKSPRIAPQRVLDVEALNTRGFGEGIFSTKTPAQRQAEILGRDLREMTNMIDRRKELMVRDLLFTGKITIKGYVDEAQKNFVENEINYGNIDVKTPIAKWNTDTADILGDLRKWRTDVIKNMGTAPTKVIVASDVADAIMKNKVLKEMFDIKNYNLGQVAPRIENDALTFVCSFPSVGLEVYSYDEWYMDEETGEEQGMVPEGHILMASDNLGEINYGLVTQLENGNFNSYEGRLVPKTWEEERNDRMMIRLTSRPVPVPFNLDSWVVANVL